MLLGGDVVDSAEERQRMRHHLPTLGHGDLGSAVPDAGGSIRGAFDDLDIAFVGIGAPTTDSVTMRDGSEIALSDTSDVGRGNRENSRGGIGDVHNGADDNASGAVAVLARRLV